MSCGWCVDDRCVCRAVVLGRRCDGCGERTWCRAGMDAWFPTQARAAWWCVACWARRGGTPAERSPWPAKEEAFAWAIWAADGCRACALWDLGLRSWPPGYPHQEAC